MNLYEILQNPDRVGEGMTHFERLFAQKLGDGKINEISGVPPLWYIGDGRPLTDYMLYGNTVQDGTPSPDAPVDAVGCGAWDEAQQSYKLPMTVNGTEYPIYLGTVPTTRRVKKLVMTGEETWRKSGAYQGSFYAQIVTGILSETYTAYCSHLTFTTLSRYAKGRFCFNGDATKNCNLWFNQFDSSTTVEELKSFLAAQYANGTPVTVWYVLAEPETGIVNEPLMKIGDYADTISAAQAGVTIPTVSGANVLDVPTEVKPSEVWIQGKIKEV